MEKKAKKVTRKKQPRRKKISKQVTFKAFFARCVNLGLIEPWKEQEIYSYFKSQKLKDKEDLETYQKTLKGYK